MHNKHILHGKSLNISMVLKHLLLPHATSISFLPHNNHDTWYSLEWCCSTIKCHHVSHRVTLCCVHWIPSTWQKPHCKNHMAEVFWIASPPSSRVHFRKSHPNSWPRSQNILCGPHVDHISLASAKCRWSAMNLSRVNCFPRQSVLIFHQQLQTWWYHKAHTHRWPCPQPLQKIALHFLCQKPEYHSIFLTQHSCLPFYHAHTVLYSFCDMPFQANDP